MGNLKERLRELSKTKISYELRAGDIVETVYFNYKIPKAVLIEAENYADSKTAEELREEPDATQAKRNTIRGEHFCAAIAQAGFEDAEGAKIWDSPEEVIETLGPILFMQIQRFVLEKAMGIPFKAEDAKK